MLKVLVVAVALSIGATASAEDADSTDLAAHSYQGQAADPNPPSNESGVSETMLMAILGGAVFAFHLRRKLKASTRTWQRIAPPAEHELYIAATEAADPPLPTSDPSEAPALRMRWQQTH